VNNHEHYEFYDPSIVKLFVDLQSGDVIVQVNKKGTGYLVLYPDGRIDFWSKRELKNGEHEP